MAADPAAALASLQAEGLFPLSLTEEETVAKQGGKGGGPETRLRLERKELAFFTQQLSALLAAGIPLDGCLRTIEGVARPGPVRELAGQLRERIEAGESLAEALSRYPRVFSRLYVSMVQAGEASGALEVVLNRLSEFSEQERRLRNQVLAGLIYPLVLLGVSLSAVVFLLLFVIPRFQMMLSQTGRPLPLTTQVIFGVSDWLLHYWWLPLLLLGGVVAGGWAYHATPGGRERLAAWRLRLPLLGVLNTELMLVNFARTLALLLQSGVQLLPALQILKVSTGNPVAEKALARVQEGVKQGASFGRQLRATGLFPAVALEMLMVGEQAGNLEEMLLRVANIYEGEAQGRIRTYLALLEPALVLCMAAIVLTLVLAVIFPVLSMQTLRF